MEWVERAPGGRRGRGIEVSSSQNNVEIVEESTRVMKVQTWLRLFGVVWYDERRGVDWVGGRQW